MAVFVSGSDESAGKTHRDTFYQAGFVAPENDWSDYFAPAWQEQVLDGPPKIPYLHMTDIRSEQWRLEYGLSRTEADARVDSAVSNIAILGSLFPMGVYLDGGHFRDSFSNTKLKVPTGAIKAIEPDYICFLAYALNVLQYLSTERPEAERVDFVVERKSDVTKHIQEFHSNMADNLEALGVGYLKQLVGEVIPGGKDRVPLQAADVLCWHTARRRAGTMDSDDLMRYEKMANRPGYLKELDRALISEMADVLKKK